MIFGKKRAEKTRERALANREKQRCVRVNMHPNLIE
jgi:hypothetical protein